MRSYPLQRGLQSIMTDMSYCLGIGQRKETDGHRSVPGNGETHERVHSSLSIVHNTALVFVVAVDVDGGYPAVCKAMLEALGRIGKREDAPIYVAEFLTVQRTCRPGRYRNRVDSRITEAGNESFEQRRSIVEEMCLRRGGMGQWW